MPDRYNLARFVDAQAGVYEQALQELRQGRKRTHWMWFVFPQFEGLGASPTSRHFAVRSLDEARAYLDHRILGPRLQECSEALLHLSGRSAADIFPYPDDVKLRSSMTLFERASPPGSVFARVLDAYFGAERDDTTLDLVSRSETARG